MTLTATDLHHRAASALALLGVAAPLRFAPVGEAFAVIQTWAGEPEQPLGTFHPDGTLRVPGVDLPNPDRALSKLLGCPLATRFRTQVTVPYAVTASISTGLVTLEALGAPVEVAVRREDTDHATVNTFHPVLQGMVPGVPDVVGYQGGRLQLASGLRLHALPALACHHRHAAFVSREALDRTGHDHPFEFGVWYDPSAAPAQHVLTLALALTLERGETDPHPRTPYV